MRKTKLSGTTPVVQRVNNLVLPSNADVKYITWFVSR